jgi:signal transduction histidine kinase
MNTLIHDLLDLAKIEAGRFTVQLRPEDVGEMVHEALLILRPLAEEKRITLREHVREHVRVAADRDRIFQVLSNVVGNAIRFTPENGTVELGAECRGEDIVITVADTGPGIAADHLPHVFDRYWQARRRRREGSGLGLSIARGIVEAHGGRIWVEQPPEGGSVFKLTLPVVN